MLSDRAHGGTSDAHVRLQAEERWRTSDEAYLQSGVSSSRSTLARDRLAGLNDVSRIGQVPDNSASVATRLPSSVGADDRGHRDDDPPPYTANPPPNHIGWPYGIFSLDHAYTGNGRAAPGRAEVSLALFQDTPTASTGFQPGGGSCSQHASSFATPLTPYQFSKFGCRANSVLLRETSFPDNEIAEKIDDTKSRSKPIESREPSRSPYRSIAYYQIYSVYSEITVA